MLIFADLVRLLTFVHLLRRSNTGVDWYPRSNVRSDADLLQRQRAVLPVHRRNVHSVRLATSARTSNADTRFRLLHGNSDDVHDSDALRHLQPEHHFVGHARNESCETETQLELPARPICRSFTRRATRSSGNTNFESAWHTITRHGILQSSLWLLSTDSIAGGRKSPSRQNHDRSDIHQNHHRWRLSYGYIVFMYVFMRHLYYVVAIYLCEVAD